MNEPTRPPRVLFDTNVWSYLVDHDGIEPVRKAARAAGVDIVACPAVTYECLRTSDRVRRKRLAKALARDCWTRVMPEAFNEAADLRREVSRLRPQWLRESPDRVRYERERSDWDGSGFWWRVRNDPDMAARHVAAVGEERLNRARSETKAARDDAHSRGYTLENFQWEHFSTFDSPRPGWNGEQFETWRAKALRHWWDDLVMGQSRTMNDWLAPWLKLDAIRGDQASWLQFWTRDVDAARLPREWIRWAMAATQSTRRVTSGTPGDNQLASHLPEVDMFVSTDRAFVDLIEVMRPHAPVAFAGTWLGRTGPDAADDLVLALGSLT
jgi:hypothetical protein